MSAAFKSRLNLLIGGAFLKIFNLTRLERLSANRAPDFGCVFRPLGRYLQGDILHKILRPVLWLIDVVLRPNTRPELLFDWNRSLPVRVINESIEPVENIVEPNGLGLDYPFAHRALDLVFIHHIIKCAVPPFTDHVAPSKAFTIFVGARAFKV